MKKLIILIAIFAMSYSCEDKPDGKDIADAVRKEVNKTAKDTIFVIDTTPDEARPIMTLRDMMPKWELPPNLEGGKVVYQARTDIYEYDISGTIYKIQPVQGYMYLLKLKVYDNDGVVVARWMRLANCGNAQNTLYWMIDSTKIVIKEYEKIGK